MARTGGFPRNLGGLTSSTKLVEPRNASESEAQAAWKKLSGAHSDVLSGTPNIVQAEVNGATYYRLRAGSFASSADAKALCGKLGGAACMAVK